MKTTIASNNKDDVQKLTQALFDEAIKINLLAKRGQLAQDNIRQLGQMALQLEHLIASVKITPLR